MIDNGPSKPSSNIPPIILVLILASGAFLVPAVIERDRPLPSGKGMHSEGVQNIEARLWQDPFGVIPKSSSKQHQLQILSASGEDILGDLTVTTPPSDLGTPEKHDLQWLSRMIVSRKESVKVILSLVLGGTWVGADESRRRSRYATLSGLGAQGYVPEDPEHIGYVKYKDGEDWVVHLPFEWLSSESYENSVLLLWVDEEALCQNISSSNGGMQAGPLTRLTSLMDAIKKSISVEEVIAGSKAVDLSFIMMGPSSSTFFKEACKESSYSPKHFRDAISKLKKFRVHWYSHSSTLPVKELKVKTEQGGPSFLDQMLPNFYGLIASDDELAKELVKELERRRFGEGSVVALVGQWDTAYSRHLRKLLKDEINSLDRFTEGNGRVITASYLRGVDGRIPGESEKSKDNGANGQNTAEKIERPEGDHQIDYLRRLGADLKDKENELGRIGAIGILGDDYYDKLMTLQALRPIFTDTVFFTTDLEAAMLLPSDNKYTRNLIVASGYGLSLLATLQKDIPPFRSVYQTSTFLAVRVAMANANSNSHPLNAKKIKSWLTPQVFEIGRTKAVPLTQAPEGARCNFPHKSAPGPPHWKEYVCYLLFIPLLFCLSVICGFTRRIHLHYWVLFLLLSLIVGFGLIAVLNLKPEDGEPFDWVQGISIWPSVLLRLLASFVAVILLLRGHESLQTKQAEVEHEYFGATLAKTQEPGLLEVLNLCIWGWVKAFAGKIKQDLSALWGVILQSISVRPSPHFQRTPKVLWRIYTCIPMDRAEAENLSASPKKETSISETLMEVGSPVPTFLQAPCFINGILFIFVFILIGVSLKHLGVPMPHAPARGELAFSIRFGVMVFSVILFQWLLFFAMHKGARAIWLAKELQGYLSWPKNAVESLWSSSGFQKELELKDIDEKALGRWLNVRFIAEVTKPVQRIIFYPFAVLGLFIIARTSIFDRFVLPPFLVAIFLISIALVVIVALRLRTNSERVRWKAMETLDEHIMGAKMNGMKDLADRLTAMRDQVAGLKTGVFAPFTQQPLVKAAFTIVGSISGVKLLDYANLASF